MSDRTGNTASEATEARQEAVLTLAVARRMIPLVGRIVQDIQEARQSLRRLEPEMEVLDEKRRELTWTGRCRRYELREEIARFEHDLGEALAEMEVLGIMLLDVNEGRVGFPTLVNNRRAFFSWKPGEAGLRSWQFANEKALRPIPAGWADEPELSKR